MWLFAAFGFNQSEDWIPPDAMSLSWYVSTASLVLAILFMWAAVQSSGAIFDTCNQGSMSLNDISYARCQSIGLSIKKKGQAEAYYLTALLIIGRVEACLFLGLGAGATYALAFLQKGTQQVTVVHLMHAVWAIAVCLVHADGAGLLEPYSAPDPNVDSKFYDKIPIVAITGFQAALYSLAFILTVATPPEDMMPLVPATLATAPTKEAAPFEKELQAVSKVADDIVVKPVNDLIKQASNLFQPSKEKET